MIDYQMEEKLRQTLSSRRKKRTRNKEMVEAAVLVPIFYKEGEYHILFTLRSNQLTYHKGQVSFPGGACSEVDSSLLDTALRESWEEIGLEAEDVEILGELDDVVTTTGFVISPFIAFIPYPYRFKKNRNEIDEIFDMPLSVLFDKANFRQESQVIGDKAVASYFYEYGGWVIWGATARIVKQFLDVLQFESGAQS